MLCNRQNNLTFERCVKPWRNPPTQGGVACAIIIISKLKNLSWRRRSWWEGRWMRLLIQTRFLCFDSKRFRLYQNEWRLSASQSLDEMMMFHGRGFKRWQDLSTKSWDYILVYLLVSQPMNTRLVRRELQASAASGVAIASPDIFSSHKLRRPARCYCGQKMSNWSAVLLLHTNLSH